MVHAYSKNADGPFYVEDECCLACGVHEELAPGLFDWDGLHCYVSRQPATPVELEGMLEAVDAAEVGCVRYRGADPSILRRLAENDLTERCDVAPPADAVAVERTHVKPPRHGRHHLGRPGARR